jgi:phenylpyruvate tautomerase PptA (4-oxalocrotonate tautomerase family)
VTDQEAQDLATAITEAIMKCVKDGVHSSLALADGTTTVVVDIYRAPEQDSRLN